MPDSSSNADNQDPGSAPAIAVARNSAALLLVESLIHGLIVRQLLTVREAIEIIDIAAEVEQELHETGLDAPFGHFQSILAPIADSLRIDLQV